MSDDTGAFPWTEEQWSRARKVVQDSARRARVASSFLPLYGPLPADQVTVASMRMDDSNLDIPARGEAKRRLEVDDRHTIPLTTISADIYLRTYEAADPEMSAALSMVARAAEVLGRLEDSIIFNGQPAEGQGPLEPVNPEIYKVNGGETRPGLLTLAEKPDADCCDRKPAITVKSTGSVDEGSALVAATVDAIEQLEGCGHYGPFAEVLGNGLYRAANTPHGNAMVLPSDRIIPFLDGPLLRSGTIPKHLGVIVALGGDPIDLVVAHDLELKLVQMTIEPRFVLRMSERFTLRIKQPGAVRVLVGKA
jgi:uncharacterized linocin/CFP29 family protein